MKCPHCGKDEDKVIDSRPSKDGIAVYRRRKCLACTGRFTTYESIEEQLLPFLIHKNTGQRPTTADFKKMLSFLSESLKDLTEGAEVLIQNIDRIEKARTGKQSKINSPPRGAHKETIYLKKSPGRKHERPGDAARVLMIIKRHKRGVHISKLREGTGFHKKKITDIVYRACRDKKIRRIGRGVYQTS